MPFGNLILSIFTGSITYALLWSPKGILSTSAYAFGALAAWQFYCECSRVHATGKPAKEKLVDRNPVIFQFGRFVWRQSEACRHWFVSGQTGSGKTFFFRRVIWQLCENAPKWGGLILDEKGAFIEVLQGIFKNHPTKDEDDLIVLEVRPDNAPADWKPKVIFNFLEVPGIPYSNHAKTIVDVASSLTKKGSENPFFPQQATIHIEWGFRFLQALGEPVTILNCFDLLTDDSHLEKMGLRLAAIDTEEAKEVLEHFANSYLSLNEETFRGVQSTIAGYLSYFTSPEIAEVFCSEQPSTFTFADLDKGKVATVAMPQRFAVERRYIYTLLKLSFYNHGLQRFDKPAKEREGLNLLVGLFDEFQKTATANEAGLSDYNTVDTLREACVMIMTGTQSTQSLVPPMGADKAKVFIANMGNRVIFKAADEESARPPPTASASGKSGASRRAYRAASGHSTSTRKTAISCSRTNSENCGNLSVWFSTANRAGRN